MRQNLSLLLVAILSLIAGTSVSQSEESFSYSVQRNGEFLLQIQHAEVKPNSYRVELQELNAPKQRVTVAGFAATKLPGVVAVKWKAEAPQGVYMARLFRGQREIALIHGEIQMPDNYSAENVKIDRRQGRVKWRTPRACLARVNAVLSNGMRIDTIAPWHFSANSENAVEWNFSDRTKARNYRDNPGLQVFVQYVPLPDYLVIVGRPAFEPYERQPVFAALPLPTGEQEVSLEAISDAERIVPELPGIALPVVKVGSGLRVKLDPTTKANIGKSRYEIMIYANGEFIYEEPEGADPYTFLMPDLPRKSGLLYLSVNIMDYNGNAGSYTLPVWFDSNLD